MTNADKLQVSSQMFDRGILSTNDVMAIWNLPAVADGDKRYIRKEYTEVSKLDEGDTPAPTTEEPATTPESNENTDEHKEGNEE
jgi:hypothetical protein